MAGLGRSNSLSINTSGGLFGNNASQGQQSAGLFGSTANASQPQSTGGLFGSTSTSQPQPGGLFGGAAATSQPPQPGSLFGGQTNTSQPQSTGLFGSLNKPATTGTSGGLFGSSTAQPQPQQSGGLFGAALGGNTQNPTQTSQSGGLFAGAGQQAQGQPQKASMFGLSAAQQNNTSSLFGNMNAQQNQTTPSLFGATQQTQPQQQQPGSMFGGLSTSQNKPFGLGSTSNNMNASQAVQMSSLDSIKGTTRFSDLHPEFQAQIIQLEEGIQKKVNQSQQTRQSLPQHVEHVASIAPDVVYVENFLSTIELGLDNDSSNISHLKAQVRKDAEDASLSFRAIENQALPPQFRYGNTGNLTTSTTKPSPSTSLDDDDPSKPVDLLNYFDRRTDNLGSTLGLYQKQIREIESHLRAMEAGTLEKAHQLSGSRSSSQDQRRQLVEALKAIEGAILDSAKRVGKVRDEVTKQTLGHVGAGLL